MPVSSLVFFPFFTILGGISLLILFSRLMSSRQKGMLSFIACLIAFCSVFITFIHVLNKGALQGTLFTWDGPLSYAYHADGLSLLFALMASGIGAIVLFYSIDYMAEEPGSTRFYVLMLIFIGGVVHLVYSANLFIFYASWELIGICSFLLVGFWYQQKEAVQGARKVLIMTHLAGYGLLSAFIIIFLRTGNAIWTDPALINSLTTGLFLLILVAAIAKSVQFPLHTWIPDAMAAPTPVSALLHSACYVTTGVYLIARLYSLGEWHVSWNQIVIWIGNITMIVGVLYALIQTDLKRMLAYSTISQIGYMVVGLGLGTPLGICAGLLHCLNHGFFKGGLFLGAGAVQHYCHTRDMNKLGGLAKKMPATMLFWFLNAGAIAGLPLMSGFVSKWLLYNAALEAGQVITVLIAWVVSILTVFYLLKATSTVFFGRKEWNDNHKSESPPSIRWGMGIMAGFSLLLGVVPQLPIKFIINPALSALGITPDTRITWLGLSTNSGSWWSTGGLILAITAFSVGFLFYYLVQSRKKKEPAKVKWTGVFTGGEPLLKDGQISAGDFSEIIRQNLLHFYHWLDMDRYYQAVWKVLLQISKGFSQVSLRLESQALYLIPVFSVAAILLALLTSGGNGSSNSKEEAIPLVFILAIGITWLALVIATFLQHRKKVIIMFVSGILALVGMTMTNSMLRIALMECAALLAILLIWTTSQNNKARLIYLVAMIISTIEIVSGSLLMFYGNSNWAGILFFAGFALKLGLVPFYLWLPKVAEATPALMVGFVISIIDVTAFGELWLLKSSGALISSSILWIVFSAFSTICGAMFMLAQKDLKRLLAFSSIEDMGLLIIGLFSTGNWGISGALTGVIVHAIAKALLFASLSAPEQENQITLEHHGMANRYPMAGTAFLLGMIAVLGIPPLWGFSARWRIYASAGEMHIALMFLLILGSMLSLIAYTRALCRFWWGKSEKPIQTPPLNTKTLNIIFLVLMLILIVGGALPESVENLVRLLGR